MPIILFQTEDSFQRESIETAPVIWQGHSSEFIETPAAVSLKSVLTEIETAPWVTDFRFAETVPTTRESYDRSSVNNPRHSFLVHKDYSDIQCLYGSEVSGGSIAAGFDRLVQEADGNRLFSPLPTLKNKSGQNSKCSSLTNSPNCLFATTPDNSKVIILDPYSDIVKLLDSTGNTLDKYSMPPGTFARAIALTASNDRYWLLLWVSASPNRFRLEARRFEDSSLFEYGMLDGFAETVPVVSPGYIGKDFIETAPVAVITPEELRAFETAPQVTDFTFIETAPIALAPVYAIETAPVVEDIRVELRLSAPRIAEYQFVRNQPESNRLEQMFDMETEVYRPKLTAIPIRTKDQKHEKPYQEVKPHYYGHPDHYRAAEKSGIPLVDQFFEVARTDADIQGFWKRFPAFAENTRAVTSPQIAATETELIFGTTVHRGAYPWRDERYADDDRKHRSSQTLLHKIDLDTRLPSSEPVMVNMSGAGAFQANDTVGLVMVDSFWEMGSDDLLTGYLDNKKGLGYQYKQTDIVVYDLDFNKVAVTEKLDWQGSGWASGFNAGPYDSYTALKLTSDYNPSYLIDHAGGFDNAVNTINTSSADPIFSKVPYNGCLRLYGDTIAWSGQSYRGPMETPEGYATNESAATDFHVLKEFDSGLVELNNLMIAGAPKALLAFSIGSSNGFFETAPVVAPSGSWSFVETAPEVVNIYNEILETAPYIVCDFQVETAPVFYESGAFIETAPVIANPGYHDTLELITNTSPNEALDAITLIGRHPNGCMGTYPYGARFWRKGDGQLKDGQQAETWRVDFLKNLEADLVDRTDPYLDNRYPEENEQYRYRAFPYPVQYCSDNDNELIFGLFRPAEGNAWAGNTYAFKQSDGSYVDDTGATFFNPRVECGNMPIGGVLHKYNRVNTIPLKSTYIPGYIQKDTISEYDPFFQIRYFGHSPKDQRLYVIRAFGRRDFSHQGSAYINNWDNPFARGGDDGVPYTVESESLPPIPTPGVAYLPEEAEAFWQPSEPLGTPYGKYPSALNVPTLDYTDNTPSYSIVNNTMTLNNFSTPYEGQIVEVPDVPNFFMFDIGQSIQWDQKANTYENRDILVYNYDLELIDRIVSVNGIDSEEVILHVIERGGTYYILTQVKDEAFDWAKYHAELAIGQPNKTNFEDTKYGYNFRALRLYSIESTMYGTASLVSELPWAGHSVGDTLIQEVTDTHAWLNWSGAHKARAGSCLGVGVWLDGSGYVEVPGLVGIYQDYLDSWTLLCYKNTSKGSTTQFIDTHYKFDPPSTSGRKYLTGFAAEKFPRWGDGEVSDMIELNETNLTVSNKDVAYHPPEDWYRAIEEKEDDFHNDVHNAVFGADYYPGGTQPGYSQAVKRRHYNFIECAPVVVEAVEKSTPETWFEITSGGPDTL